MKIISSRIFVADGIDDTEIVMLMLSWKNGAGETRKIGIIKSDGKGTGGERPPRGIEYAIFRVCPFQFMTYYLMLAYHYY